MAEVLAAIDSVDLGAPWVELAPLVRPILPRRRPLPPMSGTLVSRQQPPGLTVGLGLDIGPAIVFVGSEQLSGWRVRAATAFAQAEANIRDEVLARRYHALFQERVAGVPMTVFQSGEGWAATLVLYPELLAHVMGDRPGLVLAPLRDVLLGLPIDTDRELAGSLLEGFAKSDANCLAVPVLAYVDGRVSLAPPLGAARDGRPA